MISLFRPQKIELGATGGAAKQDSTNMEDMSVEQMAVRANQLTDEVLMSPVCFYWTNVKSFGQWNET